MTYTQCSLCKGLGVVVVEGKPQTCPRCEGHLYVEAPQVTSGDLTGPEEHGTIGQLSQNP